MSTYLAALRRSAGIDVAPALPAAVQGAGFDPVTLGKSVCNLGMVPGELTHMAPLGTGVPIDRSLSSYSQTFRVGFRIWLIFIRYGVCPVGAVMVPVRPGPMLTQAFIE